MKKSISVKGKTHDRLKGFLDGEPMGPWVEKLINDALDAAEEAKEREIRRQVNVDLISLDYDEDGPP